MLSCRVVLECLIYAFCRPSSVFLPLVQLGDGSFLRTSDSKLHRDCPRHSGQTSPSFRCLSLLPFRLSLPCGMRLPPGCTQLVLFCIRGYSFVNLPPLFFCKVVVVNIALNNLSPSLLSAFAEYLHSYGLVRLPFHAFCSRYPETDIPCSALKPNFKSCRLYNGGHIAS